MKRISRSLLLLLLAAPAWPNQTPTGLYFEITGEGPAVVLLPGTGLDSRSFDQQVAALAGQHKVVRYDPRGLGHTAVPQQAFDPRADVISVLDSGRIDRAVLVGQSGGASLAIDTALAYPERVRALVLIAPGLSGFPFPDGELQRFQEIARVGSEQGHASAVDLMLQDPYLETVIEQPAVLQRVRALYLSNSEMWNPANFATTAPGEPAIGRLDEIRVPTLILVGSRDLPQILEISRLLADRIDGARLETITGRGHLLQMEAPGQVNASLERFLGEPEAASPP